jgi:hypothetical protein
MPTLERKIGIVGLTLTLLMLTSACASPGPAKVTVVTHDAFAISEKVLASFGSVFLTDRIDFFAESHIRYERPGDADRLRRRLHQR